MLELRKRKGTRSEEEEMHSYPVDMTQKPSVKPFFDAETNTISYVVRDPASNDCAVIDAVMDFDYPASQAPARRSLHHDF